MWDVRRPVLCENQSKDVIFLIKLLNDWLHITLLLIYVYFQTLQFMYIYASVFSFYIPIKNITYI